MSPHRRIAALLVAAAGALVLIAQPAADAAVTGHITSISTASFNLTADWSDDALATSLRATVNTPVTLTDLMSDLSNSTAACDSSQLHVLPEHYNGTNPTLSGSQILHSSDHFCWDSGDSMVSYWIPQGITGSYDGAIDGSLEGQTFTAVSWYYSASAVPADPTPPIDYANKGVRITFVNAAHTMYRSVLLVEPTSSSDYKPVVVHAGGISLAGHYLYVTDSTHGLRVFDLDKMMTVTSTDKTIIGKSGTSYYAYGYKYILPQVATYFQGTAATNCDSTTARSTTDPICFSSLALDRSTTPDRLVVGEYIDSTTGARVVSYPVDSTSRKLVTSGSTVTASAAVTIPVSNVQGAFTFSSKYYLGRSSSNSYGLMYGGGSGSTPLTSSWTIGGEDLYHQQVDSNGSALPGQLWTLTEHAYCNWTTTQCTLNAALDERIVFAVPLTSVGTA